MIFGSNVHFIDGRKRAIVRSIQIILSVVEMGETTTKPILRIIKSIISINRNLHTILIISILIESISEMLKIFIIIVHYVCL